MIVTGAPRPGVPCAAGALADGIAESHRAALEAMVQRFAPSLILPKSDAIRIDRIGADTFTLRGPTDVAFRDASTEALITLVTGGAEYLSHPDDLETSYFDFPGETPGECWAASAALRAGPDSLAWSQPAVFAHPFLGGRGALFISTITSVITRATGNMSASESRSIAHASPRLITTFMPEAWS